MTNGICQTTLGARYKFQYVGYMEVMNITVLYI